MVRCGVKENRLRAQPFLFWWGKWKKVFTEWDSRTAEVVWRGRVRSHLRAVRVQCL